jgi:hypothetical protein
MTIEQRGTAISTNVAPASSRYGGYLARHLDQIITLHQHGKTTREIAEALYRAGARASTSDPNPHFKMTKAAHIQNLRAMVWHILKKRFGLYQKKRKQAHLYEPAIEIKAWKASALEGKSRAAIARELGGVSWIAAQHCIWRGCLRLRPLGDPELCDALGIPGGAMLGKVKRIIGV